MDPHEETSLELPEMNEEKIRQNKNNIKKNNDKINGLYAVIIALLLVIGYFVLKQHNIQTCQAKLYEHLTKQKAPTTTQLEVIENPEVYRDLFEQCGD